MHNPHISPYISTQGYSAFWWHYLLLPFYWCVHLGSKLFGTPYVVQRYKFEGYGGQTIQVATIALPRMVIDYMSPANYPAINADIVRCIHDAEKAGATVSGSPN